MLIRDYRLLPDQEQHRSIKLTDRIEMSGHIELELPASADDDDAPYVELTLDDAHDLYAALDGLLKQNGVTTRCGRCVADGSAR